MTTTQSPCGGRASAEACTVLVYVAFSLLLEEAKKRVRSTGQKAEEEGGVGVSHPKLV